jgi:MFS family permease
MARLIGVFTRYRNIAVLALGNLIGIFGYAMFNPIMSFYLFDYLKMSMFVVGLVTAAFGIVRALLQPLMGRLSDRVGRKNVIVSSLFSYAFVGYLYSTAGTAVEFIGYRALQGATSSALWPASSAFISNTVPPQERAKALGTVSMTYQVGTIFAPSVGAVVAGVWGFKEVFYVCALLAFTGAFLGLVFLREPNTRANISVRSAKKVPIVGAVNGRNSKSTAGEANLQTPRVDTEVNRRRVIASLGLMMFLMLFTFSTVDMILTIFIIVYYGTTLIDFALINGLFSLIGGVAALVGGALADKYGKRKMLTVVTTSCMICWLSFAFANSLAVLILLISAFMCIATMNGPATTSLLADLTPVEKRGATFGFLGLCNDLGLTFGPIAGGIVFDFLSASLGLSLLGGMQCVFALNALISLAASLVVFCYVKEPNTRY